MGDQHQFAQFRLDLENEHLWQDYQKIILRPKSFAVLRYLVTRPGQLVTREELLQAVWLGIAVSDAVLTVCIGEIRRALRDDRHTPQYIETLHRRGYRFIGTVTATSTLESKTAPEASSPTSPSLQNTVMPSLLNPLSPPLSSYASFPRPQFSGLGTQHLARSSASLIGRELQLSQLGGWLNQARQGLRQVVFVTGEAGIGKTTLVQTFLAQTATMEPVWVARGQCMAHYGAAAPYLPVLDALGRLCREPGTEALLAALNRYAPTWLAQMPGLVDTAELEALQHRVQASSRECMLREVGEAIESLTAERPFVLMLEDLHWSDFATLDLVSWLAQRQEPARLLVLGTYRPVDVIVRGHPLQMVKQELLRHRQCSDLALELLTTAEVAQYVARQFPTDSTLTVPLQRLAAVIHQRTDGHPLFMVTVLDALVRQGGLVEREGRWLVQREATKVAMEVPESLQQLVEQQLSELGPHEQRVLEAGCVAGMRFSAAAAAAGLDESVELVEDWCAALARRGQMLQTSGIEEWPDGTMASCYRFRHVLYRQVAYDRLPAGRRAQLHARLGARLEAGYRSLAGERAVELATHFEQGREPGKAVHYLRLAAERALQRYAAQEAIGLLNRALTALSRLPETSKRQASELDMQIALGQALTVTQGPGATAVATVYRRAEELCQEVGEVGQRIAVLRGLRRGAHGRGEPKKAQPLAEEFLRLAQVVGDPALLIEGYVALGICVFYLGQVSAAHRHLEAGLTLYDAQRPHTLAFPAGQDLGVLALTYEALTLWVLGYPRQSLERGGRAMNLAEEAPQPWTSATALGYAAVIHVLCGDWQAALAYAEATIQLAMEQEVASWVGRGMMLQGWAWVEQGLSAEGLAQMQQGLAAWHASGEELWKPFWLALVGEGHAKAGQVESGLQIITEALSMAQRQELRLWEAELHRLRGELLLLQAPGSPHLDAKAEACFHQALAHAQRWQAKSLELRAAMSLGRLWQRQGKRQAAHRRLEECYRWFTEGFDTADLREAGNLLPQLAD